MLTFIAKKDQDGNVVGVWSSVKKCAEDNQTSSPAISQSIIKGCRCKGFKYERMTIPKSVIMDWIKQ